MDEIRVDLSKAEGEKCKRCWKYSTDMIPPDHPRFPDVCYTCFNVLEEYLDRGWIVIRGETIERTDKWGTE